MATNTKIKEFIVDEHDVVNGLFAYSGAIPVTAGTILTTVGSGYRTDESDLQTLAFTSTNGFANTVSTRWGPIPQVQNCGSGDAPLGLLRYDVRELDELGLRAQFYPQKWAENQWLASGQGIPILTKGFVFISGFQGTATAGAVGYASGAGQLVVGTAANVSSAKVGRFWGAPATQGAGNGFALFQIVPTL
jgi:hypothetical protein